MSDSDLEFGGRVFLQDAFSGVADRIATRFRSLEGTVTAGSRRVGVALHAMGQRFGGLEGVTGRARESLGAFARSPFAHRAAANLGLAARAAGGAALSFGRLAAGIGAGVLLGGTVLAARGVWRLGMAAARSSSEMENLRIAFTTMLGSAQAANEHLRALQQFAVGKPFEFRDLVVASRNLQTFGFQAAEVQGLLQDFGDAAFNAGTGIRGVMSQVNVFGTILATNKVTFGQLRQLVRAGVPAFQILREQLHLTDEQLRNIARSSVGGRAIIDALRRGMQGRFAGGMERAATTITAAVSDLQDVGQIFLSWIGDELRPTILGFLNEFRTGLGRLDMVTVTRAVGQGLATLMRLARIALAPVLGAFADLRERWERDGGAALGPVRRFLGGFRDVVEGVAALVSSEDSRGVGRIPRALHDTLVRRGLWPLALRIAQWVDRARVLFGAFVEGWVSRLRETGSALGELGRVLGVGQGRMAVSRDIARQLGTALSYTAVALLFLRGVAGSIVGVWRGLNRAKDASIERWHRMQAAMVRFGARARAAIEPVLAPLRLLRDVAVVLGAVIHGRLVLAWERVRNAVAAFGPTARAALGMFLAQAAQVLGVLEQRFPLVSAIFHAVAESLRSAFRGVARVVGAPLYAAYLLARAVGHQIATVFSGVAEQIREAFGRARAWVGEQLRGMARELVGMYRALPARLQTGSVAEAVARLDAFGREPPPNQGTTVAPPAQPVAPAPTVPQLVVQRTTAQAAAARGAGTAQAPVVNVPTPVVREVRVMLDGREVARAVGRQAEDDHLRAGGAGSDD